MALEYDISGLMNKTENEGSTDAGRLTAAEWNHLVGAVGEVQNKVEGTIKGIKYNGGAEAGGQTFSEIDEDGYLKMTVADSSGYQLTTYIDNPPAYIARGSECIIKVRVSSKQVQGDDLISATAACSVNFYLNSSPTPFYTGNVYDMDSATPGVVKELVVDISKIPGVALLTGELDNEIKIEINNRFGKITQSYCYVKVIELGLTVDIFGTKNVFTENDKPQLIARVNGTDANVAAWVDGSQILPGNNQTGEAFNGVDMNFGQDIFNNVNTHGVHTIEVVASVVRQTGTEDITISTVPQKFNYIYGTSNTRPVVMSIINNTTPEEYNNFEMSYVAYKYNSTAAAVTDTVNVSLCDVTFDAENNPIVGTSYITVSQDVTFDPTTNSGSGNAMFSLFPVNNVSLVGKKAIVISIGDFSQVAVIEVKPSDVKLSQLGGYAVYLTANNRSNSEPAETLRTWRSVGKDRAGNELVVEAEFDDNIEFIDTGSGWIADSDGNMAMHLRKGRFFSLNYAPFDENPTYNDNTNRGNGRGKTISVEFATRNCLDQNSKVIECLDSSNGQERGFVITASSATLKANTFDLGIEFKEDSRIKIDFVIEGKQTQYDYDTVSGKNGAVFKGTSYEALAIVYVDGVYQGLKVIPNSTSFLQGNSTTDPAIIRFGSNDCDLDVYNIRIYDQALTPMQIVNNYSYDTPNFNDKIAIAKRNNIFDETSSIPNKPNINIEKLRIARPELPFFYVKQPLNADGNDDQLLPQDKSNWLKVPFTEWKNPVNETNTGEAAVSWTATTGRWRNQGTSSMSYPWPWRNWDWQQKDGEFTFGDGSKNSKWNQYKGMDRAGSIKKITLKKDYASSEMCNNAITSEYFTDMALAIGNDYPNVMSPAQRIDGPETTPFRLTFVATPCFLFQQFNDTSKVGTAGTGYEALGMMNLIPNKNECDHLGFGKKSGYAWGEDGTKFDRAQSWELCDNKDEWFWYAKLEGVQRNNDGTYTNDLAECYEARYPKDTTTFKNDKGKFDGDFGLIPDGKGTITPDEMASLMNEQKDIIEFHNWLVDVNRQIPEDYKAEHGSYRELTPTERDWEWNKLEDGSYNKFDTPDYRLAKFTAEAPTRLIIDQFCMYYIWRETFWAFDSGLKNLQVYTMGPATEDSAYCQWGCMVRDADTTLGIDNEGVKMFPAHLEDTDYMIHNADGISFVYEGARGMYHSKSIAAQTEGAQAILNGQLGSLWINLRDAFGTKIADIYRALANSNKANWTGDRAIKRFRDHQEKWSENLYNFGMRQYFGGAPFTQWIQSGLGDKKNSRASWLSRGFYYRNSKYKNLGEGDYIKVRAYCYDTPDNVPGKVTDNTSTIPLKFKAYIPMYLGMGASTGDMTKCKNFKRITDVENTFEVTAGPDGLNYPETVSDQNIWMYGTSQLTEIGDLARAVKFKEFATVSLPKVRELNLGHEKDRDGVEYNEYYTDESGAKKSRPIRNDVCEAINVSSAKQLTLLDITNHTLIDAINGLDQCDQLQKLYAKGTDNLSTINLPATTALNTLYLGKNLVTLNLTDLTGIQKFELEGADKISQLFIRNCGSYMGSRSFDIMNMSLNSLEKVYDPKTNNNICQLTGINWQNCDVATLERLLNIEAQLAGTINLVDSLKNDLKVKLVNKYGNIDDSNNSLYITYNQLAITGISMPNKLYIYKEGDTQLSFTSTPPLSNTYSYAEWTLSSNSYASINAATGVITRNSTVAPETTPAAKLKVVVHQIPDRNGVARPSITSNEVNVFFYERHAKPGDIVYHDGTFTDEKDATKTAVGVCFYVDPDNKDNRLMVALENISASQADIGTYKWGIGEGSTYTSGGELKYNGSPQIDPMTVGYETMDAIIDLSDITNITDHGGDIRLQQMLTDDVYRTGSEKNNYFTNFDFTSCMGNLGFDAAKRDITINYQKVVEKDKIYPVGYINTMSMIARRDEMMQFFPALKITGTSGRTSEYVNLFTDIINAQSVKIGEWNVNGDTYMYPGASLAYAYEPGGEGNIDGLVDKFKKRNWFIPASGDLARISYYMRQYYAKDSIYEDGNAFDFAISNNILKTAGYLASENGGNTMMSSSEFGNDIRDAGKMIAGVISSGYSKASTSGGNTTYSGICQPTQKYTPLRLRPICKF